MTDHADRDGFSERLDKPDEPDPRLLRLWTWIKGAFSRVSLNGAAIATLVVALVGGGYFVVDRMMQLYTDALAEKIEGQAHAMSEKIDGQSAVIASKFDAMSEKIDAVDRRLTEKIDGVRDDVEKLDDRLWDRQGTTAAEENVSSDGYAALASAHAPNEPEQARK